MSSVVMSYSRLALRGAMCAVLASVAFFESTNFSNALAMSPRARILTSEDTAYVLGAECNPNGLGGDNCTSSESDTCTDEGCPGTIGCVAVGMVCKKKGGHTASFKCDQASSGASCSATCGGLCRTFFFSVWSPVVGCGGSGACDTVDECGSIKCSVTGS
jgi:hypothetical protein